MIGLRIKTPSRTLSLSLAPSTKVAKLKEMLSEKEGVQTSMVKVEATTCLLVLCLFVSWRLI